MPLSSTPLFSEVLHKEVFSSALEQQFLTKWDKEKRVYNPGLYSVETVSQPSKKSCLNCSCSP